MKWLLVKNNKKHTKIQPFVVLCNNEDHTRLVKSICSFSLLHVSHIKSIYECGHSHQRMTSYRNQTNRLIVHSWLLHICVTIQKKIPFDREYLCFITVAEEMPQAYACYAVILKLGVQVLMHIIDTFNIRSSEHQ